MINRCFVEAKLSVSGVYEDSVWLLITVCAALSREEGAINGSIRLLRLAIEYKLIFINIKNVRR